MALERIPGGRNSPHYHLAGKEEQARGAMSPEERAVKYATQAENIINAGKNDRLLKTVADFALPIAQSSHEKKLGLIQDLVRALDFKSDELDTITGEKEQEGIALALAIAYRESPRQ